LIEGLAAFDRGPAQSLDGVIAAAILAFGFVYIHPFEDGNGRIHRYLIHHVLAQRGFSPAGLIFPVSAAILKRIAEYRLVLEDYSRRLVPVVDWQPTADWNVRVFSDTAEFLYACVRQTIEEDLKRETDFLMRYDSFCAGIEKIVDMPDRKLDLLLRFLHQNGGRMSKRVRENECKEMTDAEVAAAERLYEEVFSNGFPRGPQ
jgi:hypothetical protein